MTFDFDFRTRAVAPPLDRLVEALWSARGRVPYERERMRLLEQLLRALARPAVPGQARCARAVAMLEAEPGHGHGLGHVGASDGASYSMHSAGQDSPSPRR